MNAPADARSLDSARVLLRRDGTALPDGGPAPGLVIRPEDDPLALAPLDPSLEVIAIEFPRFADGRGYTHARRVREELGFEGELRAVGDVGVDQLHYLLRVGFDAFSLRPGTSMKAAQEALERFRHFYEGIETRERGTW